MSQTPCLVVLVVRRVTVEMTDIACPFSKKEGESQMIVFYYVISQKYLQQLLFMPIINRHTLSCLQASAAVFVVVVVLEPVQQLQFHFHCRFSTLCFFLSFIGM